MECILQLMQIDMAMGSLFIHIKTGTREGGGGDCAHGDGVRPKKPFFFFLIFEKHPETFKFNRTL